MQRPDTELVAAAGQEQSVTSRNGRQRKAAIGGGLVLLVLVLSLVPVAGLAGLVLGLVLAVLVVLYLVSIASATTLFTGMVVSLLFSGNWGLLGLPIGPDRLLLVATVYALARGALRGQLSGMPLRFRPAHAALMVLVVWSTLSAMFAGTLLTTNGAFALLDRLGFVPFLAFVLAPRLYGEARQRMTLLIGLLFAGCYLSVTALAEGLGLDALVFPRYILNENLGIHADRARGPFLEAVALGFALLVCGAGGAIAAATWPSRVARRTALMVSALCAVATIFTLTRAVWLGVCLAVLAVTVVTPKLRRRAVPVAAGAVVAVLLILTALPELASSVGDRAGDQRPVWDRFNSNVAAINIIEEHPLTGVGWQRFTQVSDDFTEQRSDYPVTGVGIEVHNVFLSHAAEMGIPGAALYLVAWLAAVAPPLLKAGDRTHEVWRRGLLAVAVMWLVVASFGPLSYPFANLALWLFAGIAGTTARDAGRELHLLPLERKASVAQ